MKELFAGLAEILELDPAAVTSDLMLHDHAWDSLAIISTIALVDDICGKMLDGQSLARCEKVSDIVALIEAAKK